MRIAAPLGLIALQLVLIDAAQPLRRFGDNSHVLSNIQLLVPLMASDDVASASVEIEPSASATGERYERARIYKDTPFSNIPASAFVLDENFSLSKKKKRGQKYSRKQDLAYWPRSVYLESRASDESDEREERSEAGELSEQVWRACRRLARAPPSPPHELLRVLCAELLDAAPPPPAPQHAPPPPACACCPQWPPPHVALPARRGMLGMGENPYLVTKYMRSRERK